MNSMAAKFLSRHGTRILRTYNYELIRMNSNNNNNNTNKEPCTKDACPPPKAETCLPDKDKNAESQTPSCSTLPCPPRASGLRDPNNPCNYCPPECIDPDEFLLTRIKKKQCLFQQNNEIPVYLKGGKFDVILYQITLILTIISVGNALYIVYKLT